MWLILKDWEKRKERHSYLWYGMFGDDFKIVLTIVCARDSKHQNVGQNFSFKIGQCFVINFNNFSSPQTSWGFWKLEKKRKKKHTFRLYTKWKKI